MPILGYEKLMIARKHKHTNKSAGSIVSYSSVLGTREAAKRKQHHTDMTDEGPSVKVPQLREWYVDQQCQCQAHARYSDQL